MPWQSGDAELLEFYRDAIALRRNHPALRHGDLCFLRAEPGERVLVFERKLPSDKLIVAINSAETESAETEYNYSGHKIPPLSWVIVEQ